MKKEMFLVFILIILSSSIFYSSNYNSDEDGWEIINKKDSKIQKAEDDHENSQLLKKEAQQRYFINRQPSENFECMKKSSTPSALNQPDQQISFVQFIVSCFCYDDDNEKDK